MHGVELLHPFGRRAHPPPQRLRALEVLVKEGVEVGREALAQPEVVPVARGHRVAEPLMGDLVRHRPLLDGLALELALGVEDRAGIFHPADVRRRLDLGELLVGVGTDAPAEKLERETGARELARCGRRVLRVGVDRERDRPEAPGEPRELGRPETDSITARKSSVSTLRPA